MHQVVPFHQVTKVARSREDDNGKPQLSLYALLVHGQFAQIRPQNNERNVSSLPITFTAD